MWIPPENTELALMYLEEVVLQFVVMNAICQLFQVVETKPLGFSESHTELSVAWIFGKNIQVGHFKLIPIDARRAIRSGTQ